MYQSELLNLIFQIRVENIYYTFFIVKLKDFNKIILNPPLLRNFSIC